MKVLKGKDSKHGRRCACCGRIQESGWARRAGNARIYQVNSGQPYTVCSNNACLDTLVELAGPVRVMVPAEPERSWPTKPYTGRARVNQKPQPAPVNQEPAQLALW